MLLDAEFVDRYEQAIVDGWQFDRRQPIDEFVNYPALPRSGLLAPHLLRTGLPASVSELASNVDTAVPDSTGDFPSRVVRSVPLLPDGHSATTDSARFLSRLNTAGSVVSIVLPTMKHRVVNMLVKLYEWVMTALYPRPTPSLRSGVEDGGFSACIQLNDCVANCLARIKNILGEIEINEKLMRWLGSHRR